MKIWISRHGQTNLNRDHLMQGRTDEPLNETGRRQARAARRAVEESLGEAPVFDAVYASPLDRAIETACILSGRPREEITIDSRITETDFGRYERRPYWALGPWMGLYWSCADCLPCPPTVEPLQSMRRRSASFLRDLEQAGEACGYDNVLVTCHGGITRTLIGYMENAPRGVVWRPRMKNCEIRVFESRFESRGANRRFLRRILPATD